MVYHVHLFVATEIITFFLNFLYAERPCLIYICKLGSSLQGFNANNKIIYFNWNHVLKLILEYMTTCHMLIQMFTNQNFKYLALNEFFL